VVGRISGPQLRLAGRAAGAALTGRGRAYTAGVPSVPLIIEPDPDDPGCACVLVDATVAGRSYRLILDTGAARTHLDPDEYTSALRPVGQDSSSGAFGGRVTDQVVTVSDLAVGPLRLAALDVTRSDRPTGSRLGMDVLGRHRCHFRLADGVLDLATPGPLAGHELLMDRRGHPYVPVHWPGVAASACWDTGSGATIVNRDFWLGHPGLFEQIGVSTGTDGTGERAETPLLLMAESVIGQRAFGAHRVVAVDLTAVNSTLDYPMDLILGYPTIRQADWLFDFPARRWTLTS
jgi:Aspartyl protease